MVTVIVVIWIAIMAGCDLRAGRREGPRPTRIKFIYGLLLLVIAYHTIVIQGNLHWLTYYDSANALFGGAGNTIMKWVKTKG